MNGKTNQPMIINALFVLSKNLIPSMTVDTGSVIHVMNNKQPLDSPMEHIKESAWFANNVLSQ